MGSQPACEPVDSPKEEDEAESNPAVRGEAAFHIIPRRVRPVRRL